MLFINISGGMAVDLQWMDLKIIVEPKKGGRYVTHVKKRKLCTKHF